MKEFDLIGRYFSNSGHKRKDVVIGIGDDCAVTTVPENQQLAVTTDTLVSGVHFLNNAPAKSVAYKAVAVNLSDLAAMGAEPAWISLSLSLPEVDETWLDDFAAGLYELTQYYSVELIGGDTVKGPMALTITAQGFIPPGSELTRSNAKPGDWVYVTGTLGDAGAGLDILKNALNVSGEAKDVLINRHYFPTPRVAVGTAIRRIATSCIDISDGLLSDLKHILKASECGAKIHVDRLPLSRALTSAVSPEQAIEYALSAGDDYELIFTVGEEQRGSLETSLASTNVKATCIGQLTGQAGVLSLMHNNEKFTPQNPSGYEHSF
ncbi:thiamine-monophosphate kinase [Alteromonas sp. KUL42]|uniref:thiamine-phosphate kinase n=1 Tax=Alteromonas sp. KUL42 TaxID=2480797 RepID=UPI001036CE98|nr:thiamine-phosphate kinase [Alteromonas sp. KUL42]TAP38521.1 thiamine-phosphate kinase [Alteromonas sp. KUL42]GEA05785.1 thiamine-monophosphate kinase [Alteromonas sp. KUL42]